MNVLQVYQGLLKKFGPQGWWPIVTSNKTGGAKPKSIRYENGLTYGIHYEELGGHQTSFRDPYFEIAVGAILTQNTAWPNAAVAIINLYENKVLTPSRLLRLQPRILQTLIRSAGYYKQKAKKLRLFSRWLIKEHAGKILTLKKLRLLASRSQLLQLWGIGPETADSILLYALGKPVFVVDEYTRRLCWQYGLVLNNYDTYRRYFEERLGREQLALKYTTLYREYHALIVKWGKVKWGKQSPSALYSLNTARYTKTN